MKTIALIAAGFAALAVAAPAVAADWPSAPVVYSSDWEGPYVGGYIESVDGIDVVSLGGEVGYNFTPAESFLIGIQGSAQVGLSDDVTVFWGTGKLGWTFDQFAIYGLGAIGLSPDQSDLVSKVAIGAEFKLDDNWGIEAEVGRIAQFGDSPLDGDSVGQVGVRYHF